MNGYDVLTFDDHKAGHVVGREGSFIVVEHGAIFKHRRPVPESFATVDDDARTVRLTISKEILETAPEVRDAGVDERAAAQHYGLAGGYAAETDDLDTALSAERDEIELVGESSEMHRAHELGHEAPGQGPYDKGISSPGITGGDRRRDAD